MKWSGMFGKLCTGVFNGESCVSSLLQNFGMFFELLVEQTKTLYEPDYELSQAVT